MIFVYIAAGLAVLYIAVSFLMTAILFFRSKPKLDPSAKLGKGLSDLVAPYRNITDEGSDWIRNLKHEDVYITSDDGLKLKASVYENPNAKAVLIGFHGYRSGHINDFAGAFRYYYEAGFTMIMPDHRATGESEGKYITFGVKESDDAVKWAQYAKERYNDLPVALAGISMGAATVMMAAEKAPDNVKAILEDCGYDDIWSEIAFAANKSLPGACIFVPGTFLLTRMIFGFDIREKKSSDSLCKSGLPVFIAHGTADAIVPVEHADRIAKACTGPVTLLKVENAGHGISFLAEPEKYKAAIGSFLDTYVFSKR